MASPNPFTVTVFDKAFLRTGFVADPDSVVCTPKHLQVGTMELVVSSDYRKLPILSSPGARLTVDYRDEQIFSGPIRLTSGKGPRTSGLVTITGEDDLRLLWRLFGYSTPANPIDTQPNKEDKRSGPAESVIKAFINANKGRLNQPITVAPDLGRGANIEVSIRMLPLADKIIPALDAAGIGITVRQTSTGLLVDTYVPRTYPRNLSEDGGTIVDWEWSQEAPTATRAIIGGPDVGTSRQFKQVIDTAREALYGDVIEMFVDASSIEIASEILAAGTAALAEAGPKSGLRVSLSESSIFAYGGISGVHVGDKVSLDIGTGTSITDVLREAELSFTRGEGFQAIPTVGEITADPDKKLAQILTQITRGLRDLRTR